MKLKVYVWRDIGEGWTLGLAVAIAEDLDQARKLFTDIGWDSDKFTKAPQEFDLESCKPKGFIVGGGD